MTAQIYSFLASLQDDVATEISVNVIVIIGGQDFCGDNSLNDFIQNPPGEKTALVSQFMRALTNCPLPVITSSDGVPVSIVTIFLLHCELVYANNNSLFMMPSIELGALPQFGAPILLDRRTGYVKATEMVLLEEKFNPKTPSNTL
ncbi:MAG: enoyl-CoA hydratase-related protein [Porticoccaceae bacterium]|nr:enoyl-CoA hydratase-related protein [Porticoccaceae bacterium]